MSVQVLLQGRVIGVDDFMLAGSPGERVFTGRLHWASLLSEVLPRALIAELGLSKILLGSSGGGQFLLVLPEEFRQQAEDFLQSARSEIRTMGGERLELLWAMTENLGDWTVVRKRLNEEMQRKQGTPLAQTGFDRVQPSPDSGLNSYFSDEMCSKLRAAR